MSTARVCHFIAGGYEEGAEDEYRAAELRPHFVTSLRTSAGMAADRDMAAYALSRAKRLQPSLSVDHADEAIGATSMNEVVAHIVAAA